MEEYLYPDALRILDEQTNYLFVDLPTGQDVWTNDKLRLELVRELPAGVLKDSLRRYAEHQDVTEYLELGLSELRWLNGRTDDFSWDDMTDLYGDLKFHFERSAFDESKGGADYDYWYDTYFYDDVLYPVLRKRMSEEAEREEQESDMDFLGIPSLDVALKVLAVQEDTPFGDGRTSRTGVLFLENTEYDGDFDGEWYVVTTSPKISENIVPHVGDQIDLESLFPESLIHPKIALISAADFQAFHDRKEAQEYFEFKPSTTAKKPKNTLKAVQKRRGESSRSKKRTWRTLRLRRRQR